MTLPVGEIKVNLGRSFAHRQEEFYTYRYDFKPSNIDVCQNGTVVEGPGIQISVEIPNVPGSVPTKTVYNGTKREATKECVLIYDKVTGEMTLELVTSTVHLKKTRPETSARAASLSTGITAPPTSSAISKAPTSSSLSRASKSFTSKDEIYRSKFETDDMYVSSSKLSPKKQSKKLSHNSQNHHGSVPDVSSSSSATLQQKQKETSATKFEKRLSDTSDDDSSADSDLESVGTASPKSSISSRSPEVVPAVSSSKQPRKRRKTSEDLDSEFQMAAEMLLHEDLAISDTDSD